VVRLSEVDGLFTTPISSGPSLYSCHVPFSLTAPLVNRTYRVRSTNFFCRLYHPGKPHHEIPFSPALSLAFPIPEKARSSPFCPGRTVPRPPPQSLYPIISPSRTLCAHAVLCRPDCRSPFSKNFLRILSPPCHPDLVTLMSRVASPPGSSVPRNLRFLPDNLVWFRSMRYVFLSQSPFPNTAFSFLRKGRARSSAKLCLHALSGFPSPAD